MKYFGFGNGLFLVLAILSACGREINIPGLDAQKWKEDGQGCKGYREKVASLLLEQRQLLIGANEKEIKALLGKPLRQELQTRGQQYFVYPVQGGAACKNPAQEVILRIRFDALDRVTELALY
jgi:hypothetical protein